ncbi:hypothetical protein [Sulfurovum mangrovi]|uniref:hypothetical protein n=1 Tax=Sulfurovum mangrovi TaxID=2893889 RepID=UPI001E32F8E7|nr:hypothetical protein [Sulfurovum mangrovi]UFH59811.1 hypothetical protein LN246_02960 [Sulfurovum mangrovi]UFH59862.1 hypothetical protein LN246_03220 [Sulfurovum mangrovi]UFH60608.1 hypothetical protein LN246_13605 [Sulfurovum mangrovi]
MKAQFIRFLKDNHALQEFEELVSFCVQTDDLKTLDAVWDFVELKHEILSDGHVIFWHNGLSEVDWEALDKKWRDHLDTIGYMSSVYTDRSCRDGVAEEHF